MLSVPHFDHFKKGIQTSTLRCIESSFRGRYRMWMCVIILPLKSFLLLRLWTRVGFVCNLHLHVPHTEAKLSHNKLIRNVARLQVSNMIPQKAKQNKTKQNAADFNCLTHLSAWAWQPGRSRKGMPEWDDATTGAETENSRTSWEHTLLVSSSESATKISRYTSR